MEILSLGEKIKKRRKGLGMTLKDVAGDRVTPGQISLVESGKSNPSMDLLEYLSEKLGMSVEYLMESEKTQASKSCNYFENISESYIVQGNLVQAQKYIEYATYYADKYNLEYEKAKNMYLSSKICIIKDEYSSAQQLFLSANVIFIKNNNFMEIIKTFMGLGYINVKIKSYDSSMGYFRQAETVYNENNINEEFLIGKIYYYIAFIYFKLDNIKKAMNYSYLAKKKFIKTENKNQYAKTLLLIAEEYNKKGELDNAVRYSKKALSVYKDIKDIRSMAKIENNLGNLFYQFDNMEESFVHLNKSRDLMDKMKDPDVVYTLENMCKNYIKMNDTVNAQNTLRQIFSFVEGRNKDGMIEYFLLKYKIEMLEKNKKDAENTLFMALRYAKDMNLVKKAAQISIMLGKLYIETDRYAEASKYLNEGVDLFKKVEKKN